MATIIRNQDYEQFSQIEDERIRESFRVLYDNTAALQEQVEQLKTKIIEATDLADLQTEVSTLFDGAAITNAVSSSLPVATSSTLGGVKDGAGVTIATDGTLSVDTHNHDSDYADASHGHSGYASSGHAHTGVYQPAGSYATSGHNHDSSYATSGHNHDSSYATSGHNHSGYASTGHSHSGYVSTSDTYYLNASQSYGNGSSYNSDLPVRLSSQAGGQIWTFVGNSAGSHMMLFKNGGFDKWIGTEQGPNTLTNTLKATYSVSIQRSSAVPFVSTDRPTGLYIRNHQNNYEVGRLAVGDSGTGIGIWFQRYTMNSTTSTYPSYTYNTQTFLASA
jgi:hypothetical protein